jgi:hypothetical protein
MLTIHVDFFIFFLFFYIKKGVVGYGIMEIPGFMMLEGLEGSEEFSCIFFNSNYLVCACLR